MSFQRFAAALCLAAGVSACGGIVDPSNNTVDTFSGTVQPASAGVNPPVHTYSVAKTGELFVSITEVNQNNVVIGIASGQQTASGCTALYVNNTAIRGQQALGGQIEKGTYCLTLYESA